MLIAHVGCMDMGLVELGVEDGDMEQGSNKDPGWTPHAAAFLASSTWQMVNVSSAKQFQATVRWLRIRIVHRTLASISALVLAILRLLAYYSILSRSWLARRVSNFIWLVDLHPLTSLS